MFLREVFCDDRLLVVLTTSEKDEIVGSVVKLIAYRDDVNGHVRSQFFSDVFHHENIAIVAVGIHEITIEMGNA